MKVLIGIIIIMVLIGLLIVFSNSFTKSNLNTGNNMALKITSAAFENGAAIPSKYTCDGDSPAGGIIPPLEVSGVPEEAKSLVLIMDDPDIPDFVKQSRGIEVFDHWVIFNIEPGADGQFRIEEGIEPEGTAGANSSGENKYTGPCPPDREHRYFFKLYALDTDLNLPEGAIKEEVEKAMEGHILEQAELMGRYERVSG